MKKKKIFLVSIIFIIFLGITIFVSSSIFKLYYINDNHFYITQDSMDKIQNTLAKFKKMCGRYPTTQEGLKALIIKPSNIDCPNYKSAKYFHKKHISSKDPEIKHYILHVVPTDSFGNNYIYLSNGKKYRLIGLGASWVEGTESKKNTIIKMNQ